MSTYDVVWYWIGGSERGSWHGANVDPAGAETLRQEVERMGYVAHKGRRSIGPPEGPPTREELAAAIGDPFKPRP